MELLLWQPERVNFTNLEHCGGRSARTHARGFARAFPFARPGRGRPGGAAPATGRGAVGPGRQLRAQERAQDVGSGLVLERHGPRRAPGVGGLPAGRGGRRGGRRLPPLCPAVPGHRPVAPPDQRGGHRPGDDRRGGPGLAAGGAGRRGWGDSPGTLGGGRRQARHQGLCGGDAEAGPAHGGAAAQGPRSCTSATPGPTHGGPAANGNSTDASTAATWGA